MKKRNRTARIVLLAIIGVIIALFMVQTVNARKMKLSPDDILALNVTVYDENKTRKEYSYDQANGYIEIKKDDLDTFAETLSSLEYRAFDIKSGFNFINVDYPCQEVMVYRRRNQDLCSSKWYRTKDQVLY